MQSFLIVNGSIQVCDAAGRRAEALAVREGRIVAAGDGETARHALGDGYEVIDLAGRCVVPGLVDAHNHHALGGRAALFETQVSPLASYDELLNDIRRAAENTPPDKWILGGCFDIGLSERLNTPQALADLDAASGGRPVALRDLSYHNRWTNSASLAAAGITDSSPDPANGTICRDASGKPTGLLLETACVLVDTAVEAATFDGAANGRVARHAVEILNSHGITAIQDAMTSFGMAETLVNLDRAGELNSWAVLSLVAQDTPVYIAGPIGAELFALKDRLRSRHVHPSFAKIFLDGVPMTGTAAMLEPYRETAGFGCCYRGGATMTLPQLSRMLAQIEKAGLAAKIHCAGDASTRLALDAIEVLRDFNGPSDLRHQIAHASLVHDEDIARMAKLRVTAELSPMIWFPNAMSGAILSVLDDKVLANAFPVADYLAAGSLIAGGSDWPVAPSPDPWIGIEGLVTRRDPTGAFPGENNPSQAIPALEALRAFTLYAARAIGLEHEIGSLEAGKAADFVILDQDIITCAPDDIADTKVLSTWFGGRKVYER